MEDQKDPVHVFWWAVTQCDTTIYNYVRGNTWEREIFKALYVVLMHLDKPLCFFNKYLSSA